MLPYNETAYEDIIEILQHVHKYVPSKTVDRELKLPDEETMKYTEQHYAVTLVGGDQLTVARIRGAHRIRSNSTKSEDRLDGLLPVAEDWHSNMCLLQVIDLLIVNLSVLIRMEYNHSKYTIPFL